MEENRNKLRKTLAGLFAFGIAYNALVAWLERRGYNRGITALLVAFGTAVTLVAFFPLLGWRVIEAILAGFVASGSPMIIGSLWRYIAERARVEERDRKETLHTLGGK
jgi:predicted PurR-regulated permease PerM